jgi:hypothetical protein
MSTNREAVIAGLRELADFLEAHPTLPAATMGRTIIYVEDKALLAQVAREGGSWRKDFSENWFSLEKSFGGGVQLDVYTDRAKVCRAVVVGKEMLPAVAALPEREVDKIEWVCDDAVLAGAR